MTNCGQQNALVLLEHGADPNAEDARCSERLRTGRVPRAEAGQAGAIVAALLAGPCALLRRSCAQARLAHMELRTLVRALSACRRSGWRHARVHLQ